MVVVVVMVMVVIRNTTWFGWFLYSQSFDPHEVINEPVKGKYINVMKLYYQIVLVCNT